MKLILAPNNVFCRGMRCGVCGRSFSSKDTISIELTHDELVLQFHTVDDELVCNSCAKEHAPEQWDVLREITQDAIVSAEAAAWAAAEAEL
jgi:hypothetical protein